MISAVRNFLHSIAVPSQVHGGNGEAKMAEVLTPEKCGRDQLHDANIATLNTAAKIDEGTDRLATMVLSMRGEPSRKRRKTRNGD